MTAPAHPAGMAPGGRVIAATIARFTCAAFELDGAPPLGGLVVVEDGEPRIVGVVAEVQTEGIDPGRRLAARGGREDDRDKVLLENPQVPALLQTTFDVVVTGYAAGGTMLQHLPDAPAGIYARVRACDAAETAAFFAHFDALRLVLASGPFADEVVAACLRRAAHERDDRRAFLIRAGKALAAELATEPDRLTTILGRIRP